MNEPAIPRPRRRWRWVKRIGLAILILLFLAVAVFVIEWKLTRMAGQRKLDAITARLDVEDPGWRFDDIVAAHNAKVPPDESNSAVKALAIVKRFPNDSGAVNHLLSPTNFHRLLNETLPNDQWEILEGIYPNWEPGIIELRTWNADTPRGALKIEYLGGNPLEISYENAQQFRKALYALSWDANRSAYFGEADRALGSAVAGLHLLRSVDFQPCFIPFLVRVATGDTALRSIEQTLAWSPNASDQALAAAQELVWKESWTLSLRPAILRERAFAFKAYEMFDCGEIDLIKEREAKELWNDIPHRKNLPGNMAVSLAAFDEVFALDSLPADQKAQAAAQWKKPPRTPEFIYTAVLAPGAAKILFDAEARYRAKCLCTAVGIACERYRLKHGKWPEKLDALAEFGMPTGLLDPFDGQPLRYKLEVDGPIVYSIGSDGVDDGGEVLLRTGMPRDVGFRLWDVDRRKVPKK